MISAVRVDSVREFVVRGSLPLAVAMIIADRFFTFGSFFLECLAFLALWYSLDYVWSGVSQFARVTRTTDAPRQR
jgi:hypothetical protein